MNSNIEYLQYLQVPASMYIFNSCVYQIGRAKKKSYGLAKQPKPYR